MLTISVRDEVSALAFRLSNAFEREQLRFATARALTWTAGEIQREVRGNMPRRFTIRRQWVIQGIRMEAARKDTLTARVYSRDEFMGRQEFGGTKNPLGNYIAIPTSMVRRTPKDMIRKADRPKQLGDRAEIVDHNGRKYLALKKPRAGANGQRLRFLYLLVPRAQVRERLGLRKDADAVIRARFSELLRQSLDQAIAAGPRR